MNDAFGWPQTVLVLGGGSEIALATCELLAGKRAATFVLAGRPSAALDQAAERLRRRGATVEVEAFDADDVDEHEAFVEHVTKRLPDLDLVLLAFGILGDQDEAAADHNTAVRIARTNYLGAVSVAIPLAVRLRAQGHGVLAVLSSVAAERPRRANFVYGSSKAGLDAFATGLGDRLHGSGARVMVVRPGFVHTRMTEGMKAMPLSTTPEQVAEAIARGLRRGAETVWAPPALRVLMSVLRHLPRAVFRRLPM